MKRKNKNSYWKGFAIGLIISAVANWVTLSDLQIVNVLVGGGLGLIAFWVFKVEN